jgi:hypothetical protein
MDHMLYPTFEIVERRGIIPRIKLPLDYEELVSRFYACGARQIVEKFARDLESLTRESESEKEIRLQWDDKKGLTNIAIAAQGGLDINEGGYPSFQEHNLGWMNSFLSGAVAMKYISELLKSRESSPE